MPPRRRERAPRCGSRTEATALERRGDRWRVALRGPSGDGAIDARIVIAADGVETLVARWAGLDTRVPARDMESCAQYVVSNISFDPDAIYLHFGRHVAPGGYAWIFPKASRRRERRARNRCLTSRRPAGARVAR